MRGQNTAQRDVAYLINVEDRIPATHPIREVKRMTDTVLRGMDELFAEMYAAKGRPSIPPERLLKAKVLMALFSVRSDRQFCERLRYDLLFQWFLDMNPDDESFDASSFSQNQTRLLQHQVADVFFSEVVQLAKARGWVSNEHFSVDGTLVEAWASLKSFKPKGSERGPGDGNGWSDFRGQKRANDTHESSTDPEAKLRRKGDGREARLSFGLHAAMENRHGLCVHLQLTPAVGVTETEAALGQLDELIDRGFDPRRVGADRGYHTRGFVEGCRQRAIIPHVAPMPDRKVTGLDQRTLRTATYRISQVIRRRIEEIFGWCKTTGGLRKCRYRGVARNHGCAQFVGATWNLVRMAKLTLTAPPQPTPA